MLLLKKKKYAGQMVTNYLQVLKHKVPEVYKMEYKGLDLVRRDWSRLTKQISIKVLDLLFNDHDITDISDFLTKINQKIDKFPQKQEMLIEGDINLSLGHFIITK